MSIQVYCMIKDLHVITTTSELNNFFTLFANRKEKYKNNTEEFKILFENLLLKFFQEVKIMFEKYFF